MRKVVDSKVSPKTKDKFSAGGYKNVCEGREIVQWIGKFPGI